MNTAGIEVVINPSFPQHLVLLIEWDPSACEAMLAREAACLVTTLDGLLPPTTLRFVRQHYALQAKADELSDQIRARQAEGRRPRWLAALVKIAGLLGFKE